MTHVHLPPGEGSWSWPAVVKGFSFTKERILLLSTTVIFCGLPGLLVTERSSFLRTFQGVDLADFDLGIFDFSD